MSNRPYEELLVSDIVVQAGKDRYPRSSDRPDETFEAAPGVASWRTNLVAASQRFNMYFAAFEDKVHVSYPRGIRQTILSLPDTILDLPVSEKAVPGDLDPSNPHQVNNMIVGLLGNLEILLLACDDGDVMAWYTHVLKHHIEQLPANLSKAPTSTIKPFFHENAGKSAWGLAIHANTRLIAVGTNKRQVLVYCFANPAPFEFGSDLDTYDIPSGLYQERLEQLEVSKIRNMFLEIKDPQWTGPSRELGRNVVLVYDLRHRGHNIPSVDFIANSNDEASHVVSTDITGALWYLSLREHNVRREPGLLSQFGWQANMGWGVLNIPLHYFKHVKGPCDAIGYEPGESGRQVALNFDTETKSPGPRSRAALKFNTSEHSALLRIFAHDVQLLPPTHHPKEFSLANPIIFDFKNPCWDKNNLIVYSPENRAMDRMNMFQLIPELSVLVIASQIGRVVVFTLTRLPDTRAKKPVTCLRRDAILPYRQHDHNRPAVPLLGIAVAPVPRSKPENERWARGSIAFRLWLHYADHTILSYELRRENHDQLGIF